MTFQAPSINWMVVYPQLALIATGIIVMLIDTFSPRGRKGHIAYVALLGTVVYAALSFSLWGRHIVAFEKMIVLDSFSLFLNLVFAVATALTILTSVRYVVREGIPEGEYFALILFSASGMSLLASGTDLLIIFLGLEIMSIALYVLTAITRDRLLSNEAALKYFLLGAFASGFLLYGIALMFGATASTNIYTIGEYISRHSLTQSPLVLIAFALMFVGFAFKVALVPFHMWTPDVYQGAPSSVTAFMATGVKAAGFAAIIRIFMSAFGPLDADWRAMFWVLAVLTMTLGNIVALVQTNIKRMLAYSSIAHAGYLCIGLVAMTRNAYAAMLFYFLAYTLMNIGAFAVVMALERKGEQNLNIEDYRGLADRYPLLALAMTIFMFSLGGIPPTAGFVGKLYIFSEAIRSGAIWLTIIAVLNSVLSVYFYLRVVVNMYMRSRDDEIPAASFDAAHTVAVTLSVFGTLLIGIFPAPVLYYALACFRTF